MNLLKNIIFVFSTGYIFVYFSEHLFWARVRPGDTLAGWLSTWVAYSLLASVFLFLTTHFRVSSLPALFLAGSAFGWLAEGLVVQTTYESLPLSISFTGLAWHALITVGIGWYALPKALLAPTPGLTLKLGGLIGLCYGVWAISWWLEPDGGVSPFNEFAAYTFITSELVILAYRLAHWSSRAAFLPKRWVTITVAILFGLYFIFITVPAAPMAAVLLPLLLGVVFLGLQRNRSQERVDATYEYFQGQITIWNWLSLMVIPAIAVLVYALALAYNLSWHTNWLVYLVTTPLGFILFGMSLIKIWRRRSTT